MVYEARQMDHKLLKQSLRISRSDGDSRLPALTFTISTLLLNGDSSVYESVCNAKSYGAKIKLECVEHLQKRIRSLLRTLKVEIGIHLPDVKGIFGAGRLTEQGNYTLQNYTSDSPGRHWGSSRNAIFSDDHIAQICSSLYHVAQTVNQIMTCVQLIVGAIKEMTQITNITRDSHRPSLNSLS